MDLPETLHDFLLVFLGSDTSWYGIIWTTRPNQIIEQDLITIAAAEAAIGLAIVSSIARNRKSTRINQSNLLNK
ncbi:hypothetical protein RYX36_007605 [Vicia faba]